MKTPVIYLHGFASSPSSTKAAYITGRLKDEGRRVEAPDLNCGEFLNLTMTRSIRVADSAAAKLETPFALIGSSLGGYLAALYTSMRKDIVAGVFLMAPAFDPAGLWKAMIPHEMMERWRKGGSLEFDHHAWGRKERLSFAFMENLSKFHAYPDIGSKRCVIVHGKNDESVPIGVSRGFRILYPQTVLHEVDDGHELKGSLGVIQPLVENFLADFDAVKPVF